MSEYSKLSKDELEDLGRKYDIELDRRILKSKMVKQLEKHISSLSKDELEELAREDGVELDKRYTKEKLVEQVADIGASDVDEAAESTEVSFGKRYGSKKNK